MSLASQKTGNRAVILRERNLDGTQFWEDTPSPNAVIIPIERLDDIEQTQISDQLPIDGAILVRFRRKQEADRIRRLLTG